MSDVLEHPHLANVVHICDRDYQGAKSIVSHYSAMHTGGSPTHIFLKVPLDPEGESLLERELGHHRAAQEAAPRGVIPLKELDLRREGKNLPCVATEHGEYDLRIIPADREYDTPRHLLQTGYALMALHKNRIVHRDVKPENIIITKQGARLADFGNSCNAGDRGPPMLHTPGYTSPEVLRAFRESETGGTSYTAQPAEDVYAYSKTVEEMLGLPFHSISHGLRQAVSHNLCASPEKRSLALLLTEIKLFAS